jgi:hypothetical protein
VSYRDGSLLEKIDIFEKESRIVELLKKAIEKHDASSLLFLS